MKPLIFTCDIAALGGIFVAILHVLPEIAGTLTAGLGAIWYGLLIYDRFKNKVKSDG